MNINTANSSALTQVKKLEQNPFNKAQNEGVTNGAPAQGQTEAVKLSKQSKVSSHIDGLPPAQKKEIKAYMQALDKQVKGGSKLADKALEVAPQSVKDMAAKLNLSNNDLIKAAGAESAANSKTAKAGSAGATSPLHALKTPVANGISAYNKVAAHA